MQFRYLSKLKTLLLSEDGASLVEYSVALIVVTLVGAVILGLGDDIATIITNSAGAF